MVIDFFFQLTLAKYFISLETESVYIPQASLKFTILLPHLPMQEQPHSITTPNLMTTTSFSFPALLFLRCFLGLRPWASSARRWGQEGNGEGSTPFCDLLEPFGEYQPLSGFPDFLVSRFRIGQPGFPTHQSPGFLPSSCALHPAQTFGIFSCVEGVAPGWTTCSGRRKLSITAQLKQE